MKLSILFCDDDDEILHRLHKMVLEYFKNINQPEPECVLCHSGEELLENGAIGDIAFLDVEMGGLSGIHTGERLKKLNPRIKIIIVTSYPDYLDEAMKFHVFRYLSKPIDKNRLFRNLGEAIYQINTFSKPILIETDNGFEIIHAEDIVLFESEYRKTAVHTINKKIISKLGIERWAKELDIPCFFVTSKSFIVNMKYVSSFTTDMVTLSCKKYSLQAYLARRKYRSFKDAYMLYIRSSQ